ncbi:GntR family transcriptional regulator [Anaerostipes sp.]|uniref:GntR family transcriptional regulator n=1 Tax=Anaerostipes sp. TaxID=1872530 RepID=UPI0025B860FD|nr:GntR family transcriptional regulator [Anaerostipes sp.]MBS7009815.1 GntR family transcriptional regulator [Anaerostipes sp.]
MSSDKLKVNVNEYLPLRDVVFNTLRQAIITGEFVPGERLMEIALANRLGVSRTPVREAIRKLELEGLVVMIPRKGAEVARITEKDLRDVLEVRSSLEELAAGLATDRLDDEAREKISAALENFREAITTGDNPKIADCDVEFHDAVFEATQNKRLIQIINNLREQIYRYRLEYVKDTEYHAVLLKEHEELVDAMFGGNKTAAQEIMKRHIDNQEETVIKKIQEEEKKA